MARNADGHACGIIPAMLGGNLRTDDDGDDRLDQTDGKYDSDWDYDNNCPKDDD